MKDKSPTDKAKKAGGASDAKTDAQAREGSNPFDKWLSRKLGDMFDQVAQEPLPSDLLDLVKKLEAKEQKANSAEAKAESAPDQSADASKKSKAH